MKIYPKICPIGLHCCLILEKTLLQYLLPNSTKNCIYNARNILNYLKLGLGLGINFKISHLGSKTKIEGSIKHVRCWCKIKKNPKMVVHLPRDITFDLGHRLMNYLYFQKIFKCSMSLWKKNFVPNFLGPYYAI